MSGLRQEFYRTLARSLERFKFGVFLPFELSHNSKWHLNFIVHLAFVLETKKYLEVGIYQAGLVNRLSRFIPDITAVDIDPDAYGFIKFPDRVKFVNLKSKDFWLTVNEGEFDLIFIDGDHSKEVVAEDFLGAIKAIKPEGVILIHDTYPLDLDATSSLRCHDGYLAIEQISKNTQGFELMTLPVHPGLTMIRKRLRQVPWIAS